MGEWKVAKLSSLSAINYGYTESASADQVGPRFLRITDIQPEGVDWSSVPFCPIAAAGLSKFRLAHNDIVFARTGATTGKSFLVQNPPEAVFASYLIRLRLQSDEVLPRFVNLFFQTAEYWRAIADGSTGSAQGGFNASKLGDLSIRFPSVATQLRIIAIVDEAFEGIATAKANAEKSLQNASELFESHLAAAFSQQGGVAPLSHCATDISDGDHAPPPKSPTGVPFITISNVDKETRRIDFSETFKVSREYFEALKSHRKPRKGDVLYTVTGSFGIPVLVEDEGEFCFQRHIGLIRPKPDVDSRWLTYALLSPQVRKQAEAGATGTAQRTVSLGVLRNMKIPRLGIDEQRAVAARVGVVAEEVGRLKDLARTKLAALNDLKKSLLHQAFTGAL